MDQEMRVPKEENDTIVDLDDIMQIKSTLTNEKKNPNKKSQIRK
jgi:hypothetical protein